MSDDKTRYIVKSDSSTDEYVVVLNHAGGAMSCTCMSFTLGRATACKHMKRVEEDPTKFRKVGDPLFDVPSNVVAASSSRPMPMLAKTFDAKRHKITPGKYAVEQKYDGHRTLVRTREVALNPDGITAWSRLGNNAITKLSENVKRELRKLKASVVDGELCDLTSAGKASHNVSHLQAHKLTYVVFDIVELLGYSCTSLTYDARRKLLVEMFNAANVDPRYVVLAGSVNIDTKAELDARVEQIWVNKGEGVIVKLRTAPYYVGKRNDAFLKIKETQSAVLTITGFEESKGEINYRGACAVTLLRDSEGHETRVKTLNDETCKRIEANPKAFIGRKLRIDYQFRTEDMSYRHPRWDRFEDE